MSQIFPGSLSGQGIVVRNRSIAQQALTAEVAALITGSSLKVPSGRQLVAGTRLRWTLNIAKTAAGTAASTFAIHVGTLGTVSDTERVAFTKPAGTAVADEGRIVIEATVRSVSATGVVVGNFVMTHNLASTGHMTIPGAAVYTASSAFDNDGEDLYFGIVATTGAADVCTIEQVEAEMVIPA